MRTMLMATASLLGLLGSAQIAAAQTTDKAQKREDTITEVVVTAERRKSTVQSTAAAITAVSGAEIRDEARHSVAEVIAEVPGVQVQGTPQGGQVFIRGVGANGDSNFIDPAISVMVDNVYTGRSEALQSGVYDVARVEVLRGPQGTLYGRNATGGSINVITNNPTDTYGADVNVQLGNYDLRHLDFAVNLPMGDTFGVRVAGIREERDGYFSNGGRASDVLGYRIKALWKPTADISVLGFVDYLHMTGLNNTTVPLPGTLRATSDDPWFVDPYHPAEKINRKFATYGVQLDWSLPIGNLTVIPAHSYSSRYVFTNLISGTEYNAFTGTYSTLQPDTTTEDQDTLEIRLASKPEAPFEWVVGLYGLKSMNGNILTDGTSESLGYSSYQENMPTTSAAIFAQIKYPLTTKLSLVAGARYTKDKKERAYGFDALPVPGYPTYSVAAQTLTDEDDNLTYRLGLEYKIAARSMIYANIATGYKAGGFGTTTFPPVAYAPEHLTAYEIGSKNTFLNGRALLNVSAYYYSYENYQAQYAIFGGTSAQGNILLDYLKTQGLTDAQISDYVVAYNNTYFPNNTPPGLQTTQFSQYVANADTGEHVGLEIEGRYLISPKDQVYTAIAVNDSQYGKFSDPSLPANITALSNSRVANAPKYTVLLGYEHTFGFSAGDLVARAETRLSSGYWTSVGDRGLAGSWQDGYAMSNAFLTYRPANAKWSIAAWIKNIENKAVVTYIFPQDRRIIVDPQTFGINLNASF